MQYWFGTDHIHGLLQDAQNATKLDGVIWDDFSYHNDACASIGVNVDNDTETFVQLHAFQDIEEMQSESFETMYHLTVSIDGQVYDDQTQPFTDRQAALAEAVACAEQLYTMRKPYFDKDDVCRNGKPIADCVCC